MEKLKWKMLCCMRDIVIKCEGIIFGGYVRDMIIHDHYSQTYYNESKQLSDASYNNPKVHPESWPMRTFMSDEMDIFLIPEKYKEFKAMIEKQDYQIKTKNKNKYDILFITIKMHSLLKDLSKDVPVLKINVFYKELPTKFDFECNSLMIQNGTISTMLNIPNIFCKLKKINAF